MARMRTSLRVGSHHASLLYISSPNSPLEWRCHSWLNPLKLSQQLNPPRPPVVPGSQRRPVTPHAIGQTPLALPLPTVAP